jgi:hypothetical protein
MRTPGARAASQQRSINLALSSRGITALQAVLGQTAAAEVLQDAIPMSGRMIHHTNGRLQSQAYDRHGQVRSAIFLVTSAERAQRHLVHQLARSCDSERDASFPRCRYVWHSSLLQA